MKLKQLLIFLSFTIFLIPCVAQNSKTSATIKMSNGLEKIEKGSANRIQFYEEKRLAVIDNNGTATIKLYNRYYDFLHSYWTIKRERENCLKLSYVGNRPTLYLETNQGLLQSKGAVYDIQLTQPYKNCILRLRSKDSLLFEMDYFIIQSPKFVIDYQDSLGGKHSVMTEYNENPVFPSSISLKYPVRFSLHVNGEEVPADIKIYHNDYPMCKTMTFIPYLTNNTLNDEGKELILGRRLSQRKDFKIMIGISLTNYYLEDYIGYDIQDWPFVE